MNTYKKHLRNFIQFLKRCWTYHLKRSLYDLLEDAGKALLSLIEVVFILITPVLFLFTPVFALVAMGIELIKGGKK